jgi:hypothetical protein
LLLNGPNAQTFERLPLYCVPIPGESAWARQHVRLVSSALLDFRSPPLHFLPSSFLSNFFFFFPPLNFCSWILELTLAYRHFPLRLPTGPRPRPTPLSRRRSASALTTSTSALTSPRMKWSSMVIQIPTAALNPWRWISARIRLFPLFLS